MTGVSPGRPRKFDQAAALERAMYAFWQGGYQATSYDDLERVTGLRRQSLIYAFGDKREMFDKVVDHYVKARIEALVNTLETHDHTALERLRLAFDQWIADADEKDRRGCLVVNSIAEIGARDPKLAGRLEAAVERLREGFKRCLSAGQDDGTVRSDVDPGAMAALMVAAGDGSMLHSRVATDPKDMSEALALLLRLVSAR
ncbi:TetR/AcrR family transcriptional regulator [Sphingopyxis sp. EG6]|uniref:TetR/AcrR family transcriptional regulator n=1 Tax=Sphingopyxis sp. EG6 TaxID=1874061 RepID=UPI000E726917|nr:TetR family transcriptional regulator C-terminal domain-containing protein [Sphingopyxis sp. EG6]